MYNFRNEKIGKEEGEVYFAHVAAVNGLREEVEGRIVFHYDLLFFGFNYVNEVVQAFKRDFPQCRIVVECYYGRKTGGIDSFILEAA